MTDQIHVLCTEDLPADVLDRLRAVRILDPACGSGNFLYLALHAVKDIENRVVLETEALGLSLPGNGSQLATHADRQGLFERAGRLVVALCKRYVGM